MWHYFPSFTRAITLEAFMATKIVPCNEWIPENEHESLIITFNKFILYPSYCRSNAGSGKIELSAIDFCHELILCFWEHDRENVLQQAVMVKRGTQHILGRATMIKKSITFSAPCWHKRSNNWIRSWCVCFAVDFSRAWRWHHFSNICASFWFTYHDSADHNTESLKL